MADNVEYDMRYFTLAFLNVFFRPHLCIFFTDYTASVLTLFKASLLSLLSLLFLFTSINIPRRNAGYPRFRIAFSEWSILLTIEFIFSLLCPTIVFLYVHPCIMLSSLWPRDFMNLLHCLHLRLSVALSAFVSCHLDHTLINTYYQKMSTQM
ncbi:hypothetical protein BVRB_8g196950 [Beta vulgaris subsp. vulgaris]|nr:hypothetical protein BVRB_8g196950 [Beta vulgaris subsp. vulgaris]